MSVRHVPALAGLALAAVALPSPALAQDASVAERLEAAGTKYEVDKDGDYKVLISWTKEKRSQVVFVSGKTEQANGLSVREIFAPAAIVEKHRVGGKQALELLKASGNAKLGSWEIRGGEVYFVAKIVDDITAKGLDSVIAIVAEMADDMEITLTKGADDL